MRWQRARRSFTGREGRGALSAQTGQAASFGRLAARLRSSVGIADIAGARHGLSDLFVRGGLAPVLFGVRHFSCSQTAQFLLELAASGLARVLTLSATLLAIIVSGASVPSRSALDGSGCFGGP